MGTGGASTPTPPAAPAPSPAPVPAASAPAPPAQPITDWRSGLTGEFAPLATDKSLEVIKGKDWSEAGPLLAKGYVSAQKMIGGSVQIPGANATPEQIKAFRERIGVPKDVTGYAEVKLAPMEGLPPIDPKTVDEFVKPAFLKMGLTPGQAQDALNLFGEYTAKQRRDTADHFINGQQRLEKAWGLNFDANVALAQRALRHYASESMLQLLAETQLDMNPDMIEAWFNVGQQIAEDGLVDGAGISAPSTESIDKRITEVRGELLKVNGGTPQYKALAEELERLYRTKFGTKEIPTQGMRPQVG